LDHSIDFILPSNGTVDLPFTRGYIVGSSRHNLIILRCLPIEILDLPARRHIVPPEGFTIAWWVGDSPRIDFVRNCPLVAADGLSTRARSLAGLISPGYAAKKC